MASTGATLQGYVNELVVGIEEMKDKRDKIRAEVIEEEEEKVKIEREIEILTDKLDKVNGLNQI
jgi:Sjoegren syndrome nuclear autoantigen 1